MITEDVFRKISAEWHAMSPSQVNKYIEKIENNLIRKQGDLYNYIMAAEKQIAPKRRYDFFLDVIAIYDCFEKVYGNKIRPLSDKELSEIMNEIADWGEYIMLIIASGKELDINDFLEKVSCAQQLIECAQHNRGLMPLVVSRLSGGDKKITCKKYASNTFETFMLFTIIYALDKAVYYSPLKITKTLRDTSSFLCMTKNK